MKHYLFIFLVFFLFISTRTQAVPFSFLSKDGQAELSGFLTYPKSVPSPVPLVIMIPGTGLFDADVYFGSSGSEKDLLFKSIEKELLPLGFAVLRMNYRGVFCNFSNFPGKCLNCSPQQQLIDYKKSCLDLDVRAKVTPETMRNDFEQIFLWAAKQPDIAADNVIMFGHSEGSTHISRLIEQNRIQPQAVIFMGGVTEDLSTLIHWQIVDRLVEGVVQMDSNGDGVIYNEEIEAAHATSILKIFPIKSLLSPLGFWTDALFKSVLEKQYESIRNDALSKDDLAPYPDADLPQASFRWWKMFFNTDLPIISSLARFNGPVIYHNGGLDSQTNAERQKNFVSSFEGAKPSNLSFIVHPQKGHSLGEDPLMGPISEDSMELLIKSFKEIKASGN